MGSGAVVAVGAGSGAFVAGAGASVGADVAAGAGVSVGLTCGGAAGSSPPPQDMTRAASMSGATTERKTKDFGVVEDFGLSSDM